jgi:hypothetical protein
LVFELRERRKGHAIQRWRVSRSIVADVSGHHGCVSPTPFPSLRMLRVRRFEPWLGVFRVLLRRNIASCRAPKLTLSFFLHISAAIDGLNFASL